MKKERVFAQASPTITIIGKKKGRERPVPLGRGTPGNRFLVFGEGGGKGKKGGAAAGAVPARKRGNRKGLMQATKVPKPHKKRGKKGGKKRVRPFSPTKEGRAPHSSQFLRFPGGEEKKKVSPLKKKREGGVSHFA